MMEQFETRYRVTPPGNLMVFRDDSLAAASERARHVLISYPGSGPVIVRAVAGPMVGFEMEVRRTPQADGILPRFYADSARKEPRIQDEPDPRTPTWTDRLVFDREVSEDFPVVKGTWVTVDRIVSLIVDGNSWGDILRDHPELIEDDIRAALAYAIDRAITSNGLPK